MATDYEEHLGKKLKLEKKRYREGMNNLVLKLYGDLEEQTILDVATGSLRLRRATRSMDLAKFFRAFLSLADDDRDDIKRALRKGKLAHLYEQGEENLTFFLRLEYEKETPLHVSVEIRLLYDPKDGHRKVFFYVVNRSYSFVTKTGMDALSEHQSYHFMCINAEDGSYLYFPEKDSKIFRIRDNYNDAVMRNKERMIRYEEEVGDLLSLENVKKELKENDSYVVGFSQLVNGRTEHRFHKYTYMDAEHRFILLTAMDMTDLITNDAEGNYVFVRNLKQYLASPEDATKEAERRAASLNQVLGMGKMESKNYEGRKVLLGEAHEMNIQVAREMLNRFGLLVDVAIDGQKAVDRFKESEPGTYACIFLDINTPVISGYEAARQIRAIRRRDSKKIPIIATTANAFEEDVQKCRDAGINAHLAKPISPHKLRDILTKYVK